MEWGWREVSSILRRGKSPAVRPGRCWLPPEKAPGRPRGSGRSAAGGGLGWRINPRSRCRGVPWGGEGEADAEGCGLVPAGMPGLWAEVGPAPFWMRLNSRTRRHRWQMEKRVFPQNPLSPVLLHAQASLSSSKPPRAPGARFSRMFLKSTGHPSCIGGGDAPRVGYT